MAHVPGKSYLIEPLDADNYYNWKFRMELILAENGVDEFIKREANYLTLSEDEKKKEMKNDNKAKSLIVQCVKDNQLESLREKTTAYSMWKTLEEKHEKKGLPGQLFLKKKMLSMKLNEGESLEVFLNKFEEVLRQLKATGVTMAEQDIICNLLLTLPKSFETVVTVIENTPSETLDYEIVKKKLLAEEEKRRLNKKRQIVVTDQAAFNTEIVCFRCGKPGHFKRNCQTEVNSQNYTYVPHRGSGHSRQFSAGNRGSNQNIPSGGSSGNRGFRGSRGTYRGNQYRGQYRGSREQNQGRNIQNRSNFSEQESTDSQVNEMCNDMSNVCFIGESETRKNLNDNYNLITFFIDSGCTDHLINDKNVFSDMIMLDNPIKIAIAKNENYLLATGVGNINVISHVGNKKINCTIKNVLYVPNLRKNLLSVKKLEMAGIEVIFRDGLVKFVNKEGVIGLGKRNSLYEISFQVVKHECQNVSVDNMFLTWHKRFAHLNFSGLRKLIQGKVVEGIENVQVSPVEFCEPCTAGKMSRQQFSTRHRSSRILEIIHSDVCGPISPVAHDGSRYFVTFIDDFSNFTVVYLLENKSEVFSKFKEFFLMTKAIFNSTISKLRCDNGGEYVSEELRIFCRENGVILDYTVPYTPQQNGKAERKNRTLVERARAIIKESGVPKNLWGEAILCANYVINRGPTETLENRTAAEMWYKRKPNVSNLKIFGCNAYSHIRKEIRDKFDSKVEKCIMIGYATNGYRLWNIEKEKVIISRDVKFDEKSFWYNQSKFELRVNEIDTEVDEIKESEQENLVESEVKDLRGNELRETKLENITRENKRQIKPPSRYDEYELYMAFDAMRFIDNVPQSFNELESRADRVLWEEAMNRELDSIQKNNTWEIVEKPDNTKILDTKWVYTFKPTEENEKDKYKARLVVRGFAQSWTDYDDIYSPVARMTTIRVLLNIGNQYGYYFKQLDVRTAFLNAELDKEIFIYPPQGLNINCKNVLKLKKSLYGLKQSSKCWNNEINQYLGKLGFKRSENDYCLYVLNCEIDKIYLLLYVDDIILAGSDLQKINIIIEKLTHQFEIKNKGELKHFLGIEINYDRQAGILRLSQIKYIEKILHKFNMYNCKGTDTPIDPKLKICTTDCDTLTEKPFRQLIGCMMYLMLGTRPDICFAVNYFSRYQDKATDETWAHLKRILRYLKKTCYVGIEFKRTNDIGVVCFVDADWGNDLIDRKSVTGFLFKLFGNTVHWVTKKQNSVTLSTTEAELVALCSSVSEGLWLKKLLLDFDLNVNPITYFEDNQGCIAIVKNPGNNRRVKHIELKYKFVSEHLEKKHIVLKYIETNLQQADILTKGLQCASFAKFKYCIGLRDFSEGECECNAKNPMIE